jgi:hypothetical protein
MTRDQSSRRSSPSRVPLADAVRRADSAVVPLEASSSPSTSAPSHETPQLASGIEPNVRSTLPLGVHYDTRDLNDPIEMTSLYPARQPDPSIESRHPSDNIA